MNVSLFIRVSTNQQANSESPDTHIAREKMYAEAQGWKVVKIYKLLGVSGSSTFNHQESIKMRDDIKSGIIRKVIVSSLSRLARNTSELLEYSNFFNEYNIGLVSIKENISTDNSSASKFFFTLIGSLSTWERDNAMERMEASRLYRLEQGKMAGGSASYGFKIENANLIINKEEAPIRALMYELFIKHQRRSIVAKELNKRGYKTRKGKKWSDITITRLLKNSDAKGLRKCNYRNSKSKKGEFIFKPQSEWKYFPCPAIVSEEIWESVNSIIREQESQSNQVKPMNQRVHVFTGYVFCENNHKMQMVTKTNKYTCVKCKRRIDKDELEDIFKTRLKQFNYSEEEQKEYLSSTEVELKLKKDEIELLEKEIHVLKEKMDRLLLLNIEGQIPLEGFKEHYEPLFEKKEKLKLTLETLKNDLSEIYKSSKTLDSIISESKSLYDRWDSLSRPEKRAVAETVLNKILFNGEEISFNLKQIAPLPISELGKNDQPNGIL